ncbi:MAG: non-ribosomal peptide synthetase, partial [Chitinophagia bacterium]|nr:non-ribosomal peptide synthetase [Chitinophagia bacterium]
RLEAYWIGRFEGMGEPVRLLTDNTPADPAPGVSDFASRDIPKDLYDCMDRYARQQGLSRYAFWMALWQILQARLGNGSDVLIATPVSERTRPEWQDVIGMCLNTLPIRARVDEGVDFLQFTHESHRALAQDLAHGQLPYEDIIQLGDIDLGEKGQGLPQVMFVWHGEYEWREEDDLSEDFAPRVRHAKNPMTVHVTNREDTCRVMLEYDTEQFTRNTAESILDRFELVARQVMGNPQMRISDIDILLPGERERLRELSGRDKRVDYPATTLQGIFHDAALRYPDHPAVIEADGRETSYAELERQVLKVASFLRSKGIEKEAVVAVHMHRSSSLLASMLGILEAGGAFFLMEPSLPLDRLRTMAEQARVAAVITQEGMPVITGCSERTHRFDDILYADIHGEVFLTSETGPASLACVIFTSGSTGVPKGAMLEQVNLYNYLLFLRDSHGIGSEVRSLQKTPLSFDLSLYELLLPMITGGAVVMAAAGSELDMHLVAENAWRNHVTYLFFAPAQLRMFLQVTDLENFCGSLRLILSAGEALEGPLMEQCLSALDVSLCNAYGPAEAGAVTQWKCRNGHLYPKPSIGEPNGNVDIWIMDAMGRPVPPGMPGELWIGGAQTGRGYINNEEETRKRFVEDPIEPGSGRRYYRTGDLAQFLPDGNLLFHGRMDHQLKVRGVRIELGDVTATLLRCAHVREAVVLAEPDGEGSNRLRAWVTLKEGVDAKESNIRDSLLELLPGYMVPFRIHVIATIPLTPHGKTDQRALRMIAAEADDGAEGQPLVTPTEQRLAALWSELLGVEVKSRDADFFRLGGHSLIAMRLSAAIQKAYGTTLSLSDFYANGRLDHLAARIDAQLAGDTDGLLPADLPPLSPGERIPMSAAQRQQMLVNPSSYHTAQLVVIPVVRSNSEVRAILKLMADRHGILRTRLWQDEEGLWQEELSEDDFRMDWGELDANTQEECIALMSAEHERLFDLSKEPGWRARWIRQKDREPRLLLVFHHALVDEWSINLFRVELEGLLSRRVLIEHLEKPSHRYIDFARWQHWTFSQGLQAILETYWKERLSGLGEPVQLMPDSQPREGRQGGCARR